VILHMRAQNLLTLAPFISPFAIVEVVTGDVHEKSINTPLH
jgi:hypothetical protein